MRGAKHGFGGSVGDWSVFLRQRDLGMTSSTGPLPFSGPVESGRFAKLTWKFEPMDCGTGKSVEPTAASNLVADSQGTDSEARAIRRVEAILLVAREPLTSRKLAQLADLADATQARTLARKLNERYDLNGHAFRIEEVAGGYCMLTRPHFARWLRRLDGLRPEEHYTQSAMETLAVIAYRQPVLRADVEAIRGVGCDEVLRQLMQRDLVRICGRSEELGRPYLYGTTKRFLQLFGLKSLERLPRADWIRRADAEFSVSPHEESEPRVADPANS